FQAEDGIRDDLVTGVQTCALPISLRTARCREAADQADGIGSCYSLQRARQIPIAAANRENMPEESAPTRRDRCLQAAARWHRNRSEERRVGKECRSRRRRNHENER